MSEAPDFINNELGQLKEKVFYSFKVEKKMMAPDGLNYFILKDPFGQKHMMEADCYESYDIKVGCEIEVKIDKINCKGQVFFEPKHPQFSVGQIFECPFLGHSTEKNRINKMETFLKVLGPDEKEYLLQCISKHQQKKTYSPKMIKCRIRNISKGKLKLSQYLGE